MSEIEVDSWQPQLSLFEIEASLAIPDQFLTGSTLDTQNKDYKELLDFVVRLHALQCHFAQFALGGCG